MLYGEYSHSFDAKGRLTIPAKIREQLGDEIFLTRGFANCLNLYPKEEFKQIEAKMLAQNDYSEEYLDIRRSFYSSVLPCTYDKQGRILISKTLKKRGNLDVDVVIVASGTYLEIWDEGLWNIKSGMDNQTYAKLSAKVLGRKLDQQE